MSDVRVEYSPAIIKNFPFFVIAFISFTVYYIKNVLPLLFNDKRTLCLASRSE